jgi:hypothetical protein
VSLPVGARVGAGDVPQRRGRADAAREDARCAARSSRADDDQEQMQNEGRAAIVARPS